MLVVDRHLVTKCYQDMPLLLLEALLKVAIETNILVERT